MLPELDTTAMLNVVLISLYIGSSLQFNGEYNYGYKDDTKCETLNPSPTNGSWACGTQWIRGGILNIKRRICAVQCNEGYFSVDDDMLYCIDSNWTRGENGFLIEKNKCDVEDCPKNISEVVFISYFGGMMSCACYPDSKGFNSQETPCSDINECFLDNFKCSHSCINTPGSAYCTCPLGYKMEEDGKTCNDINECSLDNFGCSHTCVNTPGKVSCFCPSGFELKEDNKTCVDVDECTTNNETCSQTCINFNGGYQCSCSKGFTLNDDEKSCSPLICGKIPQPVDSIPECLLNNNETENISENSLSYPDNTSCTFKCKDGYEATVSSSITCIDGHWIGKLPRCILQMPDNVTCHQDHVEYLPSGNSSIWINIPPPPIEEDWEFNIQEPEWMDIGEVAEFPVGITIIKFIAINSNASDENQTCFVTVNVIDPEPPVINGCPESFNVDTDNNVGALVTWNEPRIIDNVGVYEVIKTQEPNTTLMLGSNDVHYFAYDESRNNVTCSFTINVTRTACSNLVGPINGNVICVDNETVKTCQPVCNTGFSRPSTEDDFFNCTENDGWFPSNFIPDCLDSEPPTIKDCPMSFNLTLLNRTKTIVQWKEPQITDNVGVHSISKNQINNSTLEVGLHRVEYVAFDKAGNSASCSFEIDIKETMCEDPIGPLNGYAECTENKFKGKTCFPTCKPGYRFYPSLGAQLIYDCHGNNRWAPSQVIADCLEFYTSPSGECLDLYESWTDYRKGEKYCIKCLSYMRWSSDTRRCKYVRRSQLETEVYSTSDQELSTEFNNHPC